MARRIVDIWLVLAISLVASATPAMARAPSAQATDPTANSPAGVVASIPLDSARQDAAPHRPGGHSSLGGHGGMAILIPGGQPGSLVHSANGFGSSSRVPGLDAPAGSGLGAVQGDANSAPTLAIALAAVMMAIGAAVGLRAYRPPRRTTR